MKKILWIHHLQEMWQEGYISMGTCLETLVEKTAEHIENEDYDRIVLTMFEHWQPQIEHHPLIEAAYSKGLHIEFKEFGYGWSRDMFDENDTTELILGTRDYHEYDDVIPIEDFLYDFQNNQVDLCGAFLGECLKDAQTVLEHLNVNFKTLYNLSV